MIKDIQYTSMATDPSPYTSPDGQLQAAVNILYDNGALRPVATPKIIRRIPNSNSNLPLIPFYIHKTDSDTYAIAFSGNPGDNNSALYYFSISQDSTSTDATLIPDTNGIITSPPHATSVGNILIISTQEDTHFLYFNADNGYTWLGNSLPDLKLEFALFKPNGYRSDTMSDFTFDFPDTEDGKYAQIISRLLGLDSAGDRGTIGYYKDDEYNECLQLVTDGVLGGVNKYITEAGDSNLFTQPFFVRYALRLFDGSNIMLSAPVLMIPNSAAPFIRCTSIKKEDNLLRISNYIEYPAAFIAYRPLDLYADTINKWKDIITHIDIFITPQIYTFDQNKNISDRLRHRTSHNYKYFSHSGAMQAAVYDSENEIYKNITPQTNKETTWTTDSNYRYWQPTPKSDKQIQNDILSQGNFYLFASIKIEDIKNHTSLDEFTQVPANTKTLTNILQQTRLEDEIHTRHKLIAQVTYAYNRRLVISGISHRLFKGFPLRAMSQFSYDSSDNKTSFIHIFVRLANASFGSKWVHISDSYVASQFSDTSDSFPRFLYYPDSNAKEIYIISNASMGKYWKLPLTTHDFINGAYWFRGLYADVPKPIEGAIPNLDIQNTQPVIRTGLIAVSDVNNPFRFPPLSYTAIAHANVIAFASAAKPLSQGQFGQFPIYAFTDQGIWAIAIANDGSFKSVQPIADDVALSAHAVASLDSSVIFITDRGVMHIAGSQVKPISMPIMTDEYFDLQDLPGFSDIPHSQYFAGISLRECVKDGFRKFLKDASIIYDYQNQHIIIFTPAETGINSTAYIYSIPTAAWGIIDSSIISSLNSWPYALAVDNDSNIVDCAGKSPHDNDRPILLLTRPLKLDAPYIHKTIYALAQRGDFHGSDLCSILYASSDLRHWHIVKTSATHMIRNLAGTPYKYFRLLAVATRLQPQDSITGVSIQYRPRLTDKLR